MSTLIQRSFAGGELTPSLYARVDTAKYATGLRTLRNNMVMRHGGSQNRPGCKFVCEVSDSSAETELIEFEFNDDQTYILEFGNQYMRVIKDGVQLRESAQNITAITQANPAVVTIAGHGYSNGDEVYISNIVGMTELNGRWFKVNNVATNTFELQDMSGSNFDSSALTAYASGGTAEKVYEIETPYLTADLPTIQYVQSADVITLTHNNYAPRELSRLGDTNWTLTEISFVPEIAAPENITTAGGGSGSVVSRWVVTAINLETGEESLVGTGSVVSITNITQANPVVVTSNGHGYENGDVVTITGVVGMTELNENRYIVSGQTTNTFELKDLAGNDIDSTGFSAYSSGGTATEYGKTNPSHATLSSTAAITLSWDEVPDADEYNIYKESSGSVTTSSGVYGFLGIAKTNTFRDIGADPDEADNPPVENNPFDGSGNYPASVSFIQQRRAFANTTSKPERVWLSRTGNFDNFTTRSPIQDDDSTNFVLAGRKVNSVRHMIDLGELVIFTQGGEWALQGDGSGTLTATDLNPRQYGYNGSSERVPPLVVGGNALYLQARGSVVRDLSFDESSQNYRGQDLTIFSAHLFDGFTIIDWAYQQVPHSVVWAVRSDGVLLGLTYVREHQMWAWHRHDFDGGTVERIASVADGDEDSIYLVIKRTIDGGVKRYIEKMTTRQITEATVKEGIFMDSASTYDGRNTGSTTMTLTTSGGWTYTDTLTLTASVSYFSASDVGQQIHLIASDGSVIRFTIDAYSSGTVVTGRPNRTVPSSLQSTATTSWSYARNSIDGLWHLEGKEVSIFADGYVVASPYNASYEAVTVTDGVASLDKHYALVHVGLPYISDIETLDIDTPQGETLADKTKIVSEVTMFLEESRGIWAGPKPPTDDNTDPLENLNELKIRNDEGYDAPVALKTGVVDVTINPEWNSNGRVFIRQVDPIPLAILAVAPKGLFPFRG